MLNEVAANIWEFSEPLKVAGFDMGHRMTIIRSNSGGIFIHSPVSLSSALAREIEKLGPVRSILAPSAMHDLYLAEWMQAFPRADLLHSPALGLKGLDVGRTRPLSRRDIDGLKAVPVEGMPKIQEYVFFEPSARTLIVCDLVFNLPPGRGFQKVLQKLNGIYERLAPSRFFRTHISHDAAFRDSIQEILSLNFDRLIVGHGAIVNTQAREHSHRAFAWLRLPSRVDS